MRCQLWSGLREERPEWCEARILQRDRERSQRTGRPKSVDWSAITGNMREMGKPPSKRVIRVFVLSTFTDTVFERNYVLISTDKYGFCPLPRRIPQNEVEELRSKMDDEKKALVDMFYSTPSKMDILHQST